MKNFWNLIDYKLTGKGAPLVLLQDESLDAQMWSRQLPVFSSLFQVLTIDFPWLKYPPSPGSHSPSGEVLADELFRLISDLGFEQIRLCTWSSNVAQFFTARWIQRLAALIICDKLGGGSQIGFNDSLLQFQEMPQLCCPVLYVHGQHVTDQVSTLHRQFFMQLPQLEEVWIPEVGECPFQENPVVFNSQVLEFLLRDQFSLELANPIYQNAFQAMAKEYKVVNEINLDHQRSLNHFDLFMHNLRAYQRGEDLPPGYVAMTSYWLVDNEGQVLGESRLRHALTPCLEIEGGHIGYRIRPSARRKGLGSLILALTLGKAYEFGLRRILITCDTDNQPSSRIIEKNGGIMEDQRISPESGKQISRYWIDLAPD